MNLPWLLLFLLFGQAAPESALQPEPPVTNNTVIELVRSGTAPDQIRKRILASPVAFSFGLPDFLRLTQAGVPDDLILAMMGSSPPGPEDLKGVRVEALQRDVERLWEQFSQQRDSADAPVVRAVQFFALRKEQTLHALKSLPSDEDSTEPTSQAPDPPDLGER